MLSLMYILSEYPLFRGQAGGAAACGTGHWVALGLTRCSDSSADAGPGHGMCCCLHV
jgi:hypothetical protein